MSEFCTVVTRFDDCTLVNASFDDYSQRRRQTIVQKGSSFRLQKKRSPHWNLYLSCTLFTG